MSVITVENIGKQYRVGAEASGMLRDRIADAVRHPVAALRSKPRETFWALRDVSFEVQEGEVLGLIGRNGAGKSTLLKILSRITKPTLGHAEIRGRVGSLLEVGTGFHPELSGRENVFLNGAVLGMGRREIARKFDEIVAFAEVEKFIDTPVKYYSSGMYIRLAFAVAAHLETEILFVDEVLSVGDVSFQKKCLGKMGDVARQGRTIVFVSHNTAALRALCSRALLVRDGAIVARGSVADVIDEYLLGATEAPTSMEWTDPANAPGNESVRLSCIRARPLEGPGTISVDTGVLIEIAFDSFLQGVNLDCTVYLKTSDGITVFESGHIVSGNEDSRAGSYFVTGEIPAHLLNAGRFSLDVLFGKDQHYPLFRLDSAISFEVENTAAGRGWNMSVAPGIIRPMLAWRHAYNGNSSLVEKS